MVVFHLFYLNLRLKRRMKTKILNLLLLITSLLGYLEWAGNNHLFLFEAEVQLLSKLFTNPLAVLHPFIILPIIGQVLLVITLFQKTPSKILTYISVGSLGLLLVFMLLVGILSLNAKIVFSTIPFIVVAVMIIKFYKRVKQH